MTSVSVAGLAFVVDSDTGLPNGTLLESGLVRLGQCLIHGDLVVRDVHLTGPDRNEHGCLFYPAANDEERWMSLVAGIELARAAPVE